MALLDTGEREGIERALTNVRRDLEADDRDALSAGAAALNAATRECAATRMDRSVAQALSGKRVDALDRP